LGLADSGHSEIGVLASVLAMVALCLCIGLTVVSYIETMWMKAEIKQEAKELRKLKQEIKESK
jgi:predicted amino acid-binding ACT domain protein